MSPHRYPFSLRAIRLLAPLLWLCGLGFAGEAQHLTLRLEDGLPGGKPVTLCLPINQGKGGAGAGTAAFVQFGPYTVDGSQLTLSGDRLTGQVTATPRKEAGGAPSTWTIDSRIADGRITGTAKADKSGGRVTGWADPASGGAWIVECGLPWTDVPNHGKPRPDGLQPGQAFLIRLRFAAGGPSVVYVSPHESQPRTVKAQRINGTPEAFTAVLDCQAVDGNTPLKIELAGGRIGRGGVVQGTVTYKDTIVKSPATVWAWPDAPGFTGGPEQDLTDWKQDAQADPELVALATAEAATPIHPVEPARGLVWQSHVLQRNLRCITPPVFDIKPLPVAASYQLRVVRTFGKELVLADETVTDPWASLATVWEKRVLGRFDFRLTVDGKQVWNLECWLRPPGNNPVPCPTWLAPVVQAPTYRVRIIPAKDAKSTIETTVSKPHDPLTAVWGKLPPNGYRVEVQGLSADGKPLGSRPWSASFTKVAAFNGPYFNGPARPYRAAALLLARSTCDHPDLRWMRGHGAQSVAAGDFGQSQTLLGAYSAGLARYHLAEDPHEREAGLLTAIETCDYLRALCLSRGGMPKTYKEYIANQHLYGEAFLDLYAATRDERWSQAAQMVAKAFAERQTEAGNWVEGDENGKKGKTPQEHLSSNPYPPSIPTYEAGLMPGCHGAHLHDFDASEVLWFLGRLRQELKTDAFVACEDKAYAWVMREVVPSFCWRDQGHHSPCTVPPLYHSGRCASYFALYLLEAAPPARRDLALIRELMRFCEERHLIWSRPEAGSDAITPNLVTSGLREAGGAIWLGSRFARVWIGLGKAQGDRLALAKARAILDSITHAQHPVTGSLDANVLTREPRFSRFTVNAGQCIDYLLACDEIQKNAGVQPDQTTGGKP